MIMLVGSPLSSDFRHWSMCTQLLWLRTSSWTDSMFSAVLTVAYTLFTAYKRGICRHAVSVTFVSCAKTNKDIFEIFPPSGSQAILVFPYQKGWRYSDGNRPNGGVECKRVWKIGDFRTISRCISETVIVRWAHAARQFVSIEFSFHPCNILRDSRRGVSS